MISTNVKRVARLAGTLTLALCGLAATAAGQVQFFQLPGAPSGFPWTNVYGISNSGTFVAGESSSAVRWALGGGPPGATTMLPAFQLTNISSSRGISADGQTVVGFTSNATCCGAVAFRWTPGGGTQSLGVLAGYTDSVANAIGSDGLAVVGRCNISGNPNSLIAFRWVSGPGMTNLGTLPGDTQSVAWGVSNGGTSAVVVGSSRHPTLGDRAFRWTQSGGMQALGSIPGYPFSSARAISADGSTIVGVASDGNNSIGFRWTQPTGMVAMPGTLSCISVNSNGSVIAGIRPTGAFLWTAQSGFIDVKSRVTSFGFPTTGLTFGDAYISPDSFALALSISGSTFSSFGYVLRNMPCIDSPGLISEPGDTLGCVGSTITLSGSGSGGPLVGAFQYQWKKNGNIIANGPTGSGASYSGVTTTTLTITNAQLADAGAYSLDIFNPCGSNETTPAQVTVTPFTPIISTQPAAVSQCPGTTVTLNVVASAGSTFQWQRRPAPFPPNVYNNISNGATGWGSVISGATSSTLQITNFQPADAERYRVVVTSPCGGSEVSNNVVVAALPPGDPIITGRPTTRSVCVNGSTSAIVNATPPAPSVPLTYTWFAVLGVPPFQVTVQIFDGTTGAGTIYSGATTATLNISNAQTDAEANYYCVVSAPCGVAQGPATFVQVITTAPTIINNPSDIVKCATGSATFSSNWVPASPPIVQAYQWERELAPNSNTWTPIFDGPTASWDGGAPGVGGIVSGSGTQNMTISADPPNFRRLTALHAIRYRVTAFNGCVLRPARSSPAQLFVCQPDFDCNGIVNIDDIFQFLNAWFSSDPRCDIDPNAVVNIDDIFTFLNAWFQGCPTLNP